ncbi:MAG TPA: hypothetical protein VH120_06510 [Gemmataceae bacterium]|jgi:hypothetical protein|nr:hypothetical protein [Gemmataceae bacterium]
MARSRFGLALAVCLGLMTTARPEGTTTPAAASSQPDKLIEQLGSADFKAREAAGKALAAAGSDALAAMKRAATHPDPEVRKRLTALIADAERAALLAPKRVTMKLDAAPLREAVAELAKASGYKIELQNSGGPQPLISLAAIDAPFWEVFDKLCAQGGLILQQHYDVNQGLVLYGQDAIVPFVDYRGPFRLSASGFHYNKSLTFATLPRTGGGGQRSEQLSFAFNLVAEPKLPLLGLGQPKLIVALDDQEQSLVPMNFGRTYESYHSGVYYGYRTTVLQTQVQLAGPAVNARTVKLIRGTVPVTLLAEQRPEIVVENILAVKNKKFDAKDVSLDIEEVKEAPGKMINVVLTARRGGKDNQYDYTWTNSLQQRVELTDDKGNKFQTNGFNWTNGTPTSAQGTFIFSDPTGKLGKPTRLTYFDWLTVQHQVDFEFRDLPLP